MAVRTVFIDTALSNYQSLATQYDASLVNIVLLNGASPHVEQIQGWMQSHGVGAADIDIVSASTSVNGAFTPRVVFVDSSIADLGTVVASVPANATVVLLDANRDGGIRIAAQEPHEYWHSANTDLAPTLTDTVKFVDRSRTTLDRHGLSCYRG